jgi:hypothetical protein
MPDPAAWAQSASTGTPFSRDFRMGTPPAPIRWVHGRANPIATATGDVVGYVGTLEEVTERRLALEAAARSLREKETLLREIHHRVKNNLQIISSLLRFQSKRVRDEADLAVFTEGRDGSAR